MLLTLIEPHGEVLVATIGRGKPRMSLLVMEQGQCTTPEDLARAINEASGDQFVSVDRLAVAIHIETEGGLSIPLICRLPQLRRPRALGRSSGLQPHLLQLLG